VSHDALADLMPSLPVSACVVRAHAPVSVVALATGGVTYHGVYRCGSVWLCPLCGPIIAFRRRNELESAVRAWRSQNGDVVMVTLDMQHARVHALHESLDVLMSAWHALIRPRAYALWAARAGVVGHVRALEVTHGAHGWHPHLHVLYFVEDSRRVGDHALWLRSRWLRTLDAYGRLATHGFHVSAVDPRYVIKSSWTVEDEVTRGVAKIARHGGMTIRDLTLAGMRDQVEEYATVMTGRAAIRWSRGLRARLGLGVDGDDQSLVNAHESQVVHVVGVLSFDAWRAVVESRRRADVLDAAESGRLDDLIGEVLYG
jgi:hypothetical protein